MLTFPWFMVNVVCREKPFLCPNSERSIYEQLQDLDLDESTEAT